MGRVKQALMAASEDDMGGVSDADLEMSACAYLRLAKAHNGLSDSESFTEAIAYLIRADEAMRED